jgi:four helix bundle protein
MTLAEAIYELTTKLPSSEKYGLSSQMQRCAVSIPSNIAEGSRRSTKNDFCQFLRIASGSTAELETQLLLVQSIYNIEVKSHIEQLVEIQKMLAVLIKKIKDV